MDGEFTDFSAGDLLDTTGAAPQPQVSPYTGAPGFDPASAMSTMNMMGMGQYAPQIDSGGSAGGGATQQAGGGGGGGRGAFQQPPLMPTSNINQPVSYPGQPPASTTIGHAGQPC